MKMVVPEGHVVWRAIVNVNSFELIPRLSTRLSPMLFPCLLLAVGVGCSKKEAPPPPPPEVQVAEVVRKDVPIYIELVGATLGSEDIEIRPRVEGYLVSMNFIEGSFVKKGQLLYRIDPQRPIWLRPRRDWKKPTMT